MSYVLKVGADYFTGTELSYSQRDAKRFPDGVTKTDAAPGILETVKLLFGDGARFVHLRSRSVATPSDGQ